MRILEGTGVSRNPIQSTYSPPGKRQFLKDPRIRKRGFPSCVETPIVKIRVKIPLQLRLNKLVYSENNPSGDIVISQTKE
jgi:hypothetical protein